MYATDKKEYERAMRKAVEEDLFIESIKTKYNVPRYIIRQAIFKFGINAADVLNELRTLGFYIPPGEK